MGTATNVLLILFITFVCILLILGIVEATFWIEDAPERRAERRRLTLSKTEMKEMGRTIEYLQNELMVRESRIRELESELEVANRRPAMSGRKGE